MSLTSHMMKALKEEGLDLDAVIRVAEASEKRADTTGAERQARCRAKKKGAESNGVTSRRDAGFNERDNLTSPSTELPDEAGASSPVRQPVTEALEIFNEVAAAVGWPTAKTLTPGRQKLLAARLRQHGLDGWRAGIARARASPYLAGADPPSWFTFDWFIKSANFQKVIEGNYDRQRASGQGQPSSWGQARDLVRAQPS